LDSLIFSSPNWLIKLFHFNTLSQRKELIILSMK